MSRFKFGLVALILFMAGTARADKHLVNLSYWNWAEEFTLAKDQATQVSNANFSGLGLEYEFNSVVGRRGWSFAPSFLIGQATGGDANGDIVYVASYQKFVGAAAKASYFWRLERRIYLELGVIALYRQFKWPSSDGISGTSGADLNYGPTANLRIRLTRSLDFCQSIGTLMVKGSTIWSAGFGYRF